MDLYKKSSSYEGEWVILFLYQNISGLSRDSFILSQASNSLEQKMVIKNFGKQVRIINIQFSIFALTFK